MLVLQYTLIFASVLALVALGGMFAERSGVINLGLEGIMVIGALAGAMVSAILTKMDTPIALNVILSLVASMIAGWLFSMLLGVACISFKADQTLVGTALNIMSTALAVVIARMYTKTPSSEIAYTSSMFKFNFNISIGSIIAIVLILIGGLVLLFLSTKLTKKLFNKNNQEQSKEIESINNRKQLLVKTICLAIGLFMVVILVSVVLGLMHGNSFEISYFIPIMLVFVIASYVFLFKTKFGMRLMACGEHPQAAASVGVNVYLQRYIGVSVSGVLAGIGGFAYIVQSAGCWDFKYGVAGFGFLALAVMIFGQWKPIRIMLSALIFGFCQTVSVLYAGRWGIPQFVYKMLPYVVCMIVLVATSRKSKAPKAEGIPYEKGQR